MGRQRRQWYTPRIIRPPQAILDHLPQHLPLQDLPQHLPLQDLAHQVPLVVQDRRHQVAAAAVVEVLHIVIGQAIRPVLVSVRMQVRTRLELAVLQVTAKRFVVHITLQQEPRLLPPGQALLPIKGILQQTQSVIIPHRPSRQMLYIAINQDIHLAIA